MTLGQCHLCSKNTILMQPAKDPGSGSVRNFIEQLHSKLAVEYRGAYSVFCFFVCFHSQTVNFFIYILQVDCSSTCTVSQFYKIKEQFVIN